MSDLFFAISGPELKRALAFAMQPVERRVTIPVLSMVLVAFADDRVSIRGTDLDIEVEAQADTICGSTNPFGFTIAPQLLLDLVRWTDGEVRISRKDDLITINADDVIATVREVAGVEDWPSFKSGEQIGHPVQIGESLLHKTLFNVRACISNVETRYYLNGIYLHDKGNGLIAVATDGHRLAKYETGAQWELPDVILHKKAAAILFNRLNASANGSITTTAYGAGSNNEDPTARPATRLKFQGDGWTILSKVIDGTFPDYARVIPAPSVNLSATVNILALRRFPSFGQHSHDNAIRFDLAKGKMTRNSEYLGVDVSMPFQGRGEGVFGFNIKYLLDFARRAAAIKIEGSAAGDPFRVLTDDPALLQVLMPMRV